MSNIGSRIKEFLIKQDISQKDLARYIGTTEASISRYVNDEREPVAKILYKIAQVLNTTTDYLISGRQVKQDDKISDLEAKLAESESKVAVGRFWHSAYEGKQLDYDKLNDDYNKQEKLLSKVLADKSNLQFDYDQLKQQLAEKEKEETKRMEDFEKGCQEYYSSGKYKKDFAIDELEKLRKKACMVFWAINNEKYLNLVKEIIDQIDQQIKKLKGDADE